ncbi:MAG: alkaline shock response membrane anchor protein AmaP [Clostridia bacterium]|nr:alkaline shock response membrane anchor protein AmaP [Clostridia bacterium]
MKPRLIDRLLLGLVLLIFIAAMVLIILCVTGVFPTAGVTSFIEELMGSGLGMGYIRIGVIAVAAILAVIAIKLLFTSSKPKEKDTVNNASLLASDENGTAYITAASIDSMAQKYIKSNSRIRECSSKVTIGADSGVNIALKAIVLADTNIPELCAKVRSELKDYIETYAGVKVSQIGFTVVNTYSPATAARIS